MSLDRTSFYWIGRHSIGLYWIGSDVMSLDQKRHSIGPAAFWKKFVSQSATLDTCQQIWRLTCRVNIEHGLDKLDWLCSLVLRLRWTFEEALLPNLCQAHDLISLTISHNHGGICRRRQEQTNDSNMQEGEISFLLFSFIFLVLYTERACPQLEKANLGGHALISKLQ